MFFMKFIFLSYRAFLFYNNNHHDLECKFVLKNFMTHANMITLTYDLVAS